MYLGIDLGTSGLKLVALSANFDQLATVTEPLTVQSQADYWSEQNPDDWWQALQKALLALRGKLDQGFAGVLAIGLSGQMHGAVVLGKDRKPLRPAILWNDGRCHEQTTRLLHDFPEIGMLGGVTPMPGFTAPKIMWLKQHEPQIYAKIAHILLPKDYLGMLLHGELATDFSDAAGTLWLDQQQKTWSEKLCAVSDTSLAWLPRCHEGTEIAGTLKDDIATQLALPAGIPVAAGGGDAATGAVSVGATATGVSFISLGTSGQLFVATDKYKPNPAQMVHAFAHCVPAMWYQLAAMLNGARPLSWFADVTATPITTLLKEASRCPTDRVPIFLPYLTGERSPHGDPHIRGAFYGLADNTDRAQMMRAVIEAIGFSFADAVASFEATDTVIDRPLAIGGGARSNLLLQTIATATGLTVRRGASADIGPAYGAAKLAAVASKTLPVAQLANPPEVQDVFEPDAAMSSKLLERLAKYRALYQALKPLRDIS